MNTTIDVADREVLLGQLANAVSARANEDIIYWNIFGILVRPNAFLPPSCQASSPQNHSFPHRFIASLTPPA